MFDYQVILTPRSFMMTASKDWHICVICPNGSEIWDSAPYRWAAKLKASRIVKQHKKGKLHDGRQAESYSISHTPSGWHN